MPGAFLKLLFVGQHFLARKIKWERKREECIYASLTLQQEARQKTHFHTEALQESKSSGKFGANTIYYPHVAILISFRMNLEAIY